MARWFLPEMPDVVGMLDDQVQLTVRAMDALCRWAGGETDAAHEIQRLEHEADDAKRRFRSSLREAFTTPIDPEDLYTLSERFEQVLNGAKDLVREAEVMRTDPDQAMAEMAGYLAAGVRHLNAGVTGLGTHDHDRTTKALDEADEGVMQARRLEHCYRQAMSSLLDLDDVRELGARRELYRRFTHLGDLLAQIGDRVWYAAIKES